MDKPQWTWRKDLIALLRSLTASEKRYIHIHLKSLKSIPSKRVEAFISVLQNPERANKLPLADHTYLWERVLTYLKNYQTSTSIDLQLNEMIGNARVLTSRRLYVESETELEKAAALAEEYDRFSEWIEILQLKEAVLIEHSQRDMFVALKNNQTCLQDVMLRHTRNIQAQQYRNYTFLGLRQRYTVAELESLKQIEHGFSIAVLDNDSLITEHHIRLAEAINAIQNNDFVQARLTYKNLIARWEKYPNRIEEDKLEYSKLVSNYLSTCHSSGAFDEMLIAIEKIQSISCRTSEEEAEQFQNVYFMKLLHLMNTNGFDRLDELVAEIENGLVTYKTKINKAREIAFAHNIGMSYLLIHDWKKSLHWIEHIIKQEKTEHRQDLQHTARMLRLLLWYEFGKHDLLEYELINVERFLRKRKAWFAYESTVVKFFGKLLLLDGTAKIALIQKFKTQLETAVEGKTSAALPGSSELMYWAQSQVTGKSMRDLLVEETVHAS